MLALQVGYAAWLSWQRWLIMFNVLDCWTFWLSWLALYFLYGGWLVGYNRCAIWLAMEDMTYGWL
jgi:hypothetical protein